jgi:hypothetical protein
MLPDVSPPLALLLHEGGWDEVIMVAAALGIAYLVIVWSGRKQAREDDDDWDDTDEEPDGTDLPNAAPRTPPNSKP